jgi:predicted DNA-binding transcriptional regulator YafY
MSKEAYRKQEMLQRIISIMFLLNESMQPWSIKELSQEFKVSTRTIRRDLAALYSMYLAEMDEKQGYWIGRNNKTLTRLKGMEK